MLQLYIMSEILKNHCNKTYSLYSFVLILIDGYILCFLGIRHPIKIANIKMLNKFYAFKYIGNIIDSSFLYLQDLG